METFSASAGSSGQVWIENHPRDGWCPGRVDSVAGDGKHYIVVDEQGEQFQVPQSEARPVDPLCLRGVDDLLSLGDFNEGALLHNTRVRYYKDDIYSGIGGPILISVNPFQPLPALYSQAKQKYYRDAGTAVAAGQDVKVAPHLFSVADASFMAMLGDRRDQSIIISGESGAGKTEATKRILMYFANIQTGQSGREASDGKPGQMSIEQQVLRSNPILESFGNAKTLRNDNSSRFGKFIEIQFDSAGKLQSARISNYLLEKVRIVQQQAEERGYHAFYQLCAGAQSLELNSVLQLQDAADHGYTCTCTEVIGVDDKEQFDEMVDCMHTLGFSQEEKDSVFQIVAATLHLGDLSFEEHANHADGCRVVETDKAAIIAANLHVDVKHLNKIFQFKTLEDPMTKKTIDMPHDTESSSNTRHSMAKVLYSRLFDWLVWRINQSTLAKGDGKARDNRKIGILDIYGFEVFKFNSFEQLCINFANEKLQQHFNSHMFTLEQQLYTEEGITWSHIQWQDNREIIDSLERKPMGLFCLVDAECLMPKATDNTLLAKIHKSFETSRVVYKPSRFASTDFAVAHYAGEVTYDVLSFLEKNTDKLHVDITELLKSSSLPLVKTLFSSSLFAPEAGSSPARVGPGGQPAAKRASGAGTNRPGGGDGGRAKQNVTVSMMFRQQLDQLVDDLNKTNPRYIRCIKPNANKRAHEFDSIDVQRQLRCAGMLESIRIRRAGYSVRKPFREFFNRFRVLCPSVGVGKSADPDFKDLCRKLLSEMELKFQREKNPLPAQSWQIGRSKVFLKEELQQRFDKHVGEAIKHYILRIQKTWRGFHARRRYRAMKRAVVHVQAALRTLGAVSAFQAAQKRARACLALQTGLQAACERTAHRRRCKAALRIQRVVRGWRCRAKIGKLKGKMAADRIQRLREEEARQEALAAAQKAAKEKEDALAEMQRKLAEATERAQEAARPREQASPPTSPGLPSPGTPPPQAALQPTDSRSGEKFREELLELKKENARLKGQLEYRSDANATDGGNGVEVEAMRKEMQEMRREKVKLEVELAAMKGAGETRALEEEGRNAQVQALQAQVSTLKASLADAGNLREECDDMQVQLQRLQAQKSALEGRLKEEEGARGELRELRLEKLRLEGELETAVLKEQAMAERWRNSERAAAELSSKQSQVLTLEAELEAVRKQANMLRDQVSQLSRQGSESRSASLENLRTELLSRISTQPSASTDARPSLLPMDMDGNEESRRTLMSQRDLFEKLKQQFSDSQAETPTQPAADDGRPSLLFGNNAQVTALEEELQKAKKENVELNIRVTALEEELQEQGGEASQAMKNHGVVMAEVQDLKFQLQGEMATAKRLADENTSLQQKVVTADGEAAAMRKRVSGAEARAAEAEELAKDAALRASTLKEELEVLEGRAKELQRQHSEAVVRAQSAEQRLQEQEARGVQQRELQDATERVRVEWESKVKLLEVDNERLKAELEDTKNEQAQVKQLVDETLKAGGKGQSEELLKETEKWKARAKHFEREYTQSKQLNSEMQKVMVQMTQAVSERSDESGDTSRQNKALKQQLEARMSELREIRQQKLEVQTKLETLETQGSYYQDRYKETSAELRNMKQDYSVAAATVDKLKLRVDTVQRENDELRAQCARLQVVGTGALDAAADAHHRQQLQETHKRLQEKEDFLEKAQAVNDCLNTLLVLFSEKIEMYENITPLQDASTQEILAAKKVKEEHVLAKLNSIIGDEETTTAAGRFSLKRDAWTS